MPNPTTIAFYLPQFYPIPENDGWYGNGFTEWHNVVRARPLFPGHDQPHLPRDLGFYDLRVPEVREAQANLAKAHGIDAFCYYHYWFEGHRPLRRVVDDVLEHGFPDIPFCLAWANENWARHWDASQHEVLLAQRYSDEDDEAHGAFLLKAMSHPLYLRVDGRPLLFIYRIQGMPDPARTLRRWRELWRAGGIDDVEVIKFDTHGHAADPASYGADAAAQFLPHGVIDQVPRISPRGCHPENAVFDYEEVARTYMAAERPSWRRHECVVPVWDNSPRRGDGLTVMLHESTPRVYEEWLGAVHRRTPDDGLVLVNAWNEWAEGAYLEPDLRYGSEYLRATARAVGAGGGAEPVGSLALSATEPFAIRDRFAELYLDAYSAETRVRRRLSRLEATLERQLEQARADMYSEVVALRADAVALARENERLREEQR